VHEERSGNVYEIDFDDKVPPTDVAALAPDSNGMGVMREEWRLKISRNSLTRDLMAMYETLEFLKTRAAPSPSKGYFPISALSIFAVTLGCILWRNSHRREAIGVFAADVAGVVCYYSEIWKWLRTDSIKLCKEKVDALLRHLNKGEVDEGDLCGMSFWIGRSLLEVDERHLVGYISC